MVYFSEKDKADYAMQGVVVDGVLKGRIHYAERVKVKAALCNTTRGASVAELARELGVDPRLVNRWIRYYKNIQAD